MPPSHSSLSAPASKRVCIIGAGACGLIAAKTFAQHGHTPLIFEQTTHTAGQWHYTAHPSPHSAMYDALLTNLPHDVMQVSDTAFPDGTVEYPTRTVVDEYLVEYERRHGVRRYVRFESTIRRVEVAGAGGRYEVFYSRPASLPAPSDATIVEGKEEKEGSEVVEYVQQFDAVCVCNGHFSVPYYPPVPGLTPPDRPPALDALSTFRPSHTTPPVIMHSFHYRTPRPFTSLRVLVLGSGHSGTDIAGELCDTASRVYVSSRKTVEADNIHRWVVERLRKAGKHVCVDSDRYERVGALLHVDAGGTVTVAGSDGQQRQLAVDVVLVATGYHYAFPFLASSSSISISTADLHVSPLYAGLFHPDHAGLLSFPALQWSIAPFPYAEVQCEWIARILSHGCTLPDRVAMRQAAAEEERDREARGMHGRFHMQCESMVQYVRSVVERMRQCECDKQFAYELVIDDDRRVRRKPRPDSPVVCPDADIAQSTHSAMDFQLRTDAAEAGSKSATNNAYAPAPTIEQLIDYGLQQAAADSHGSWESGLSLIVASYLTSPLP